MDLLLAEAVQHLEVHLFVPLCCSTLPCWHPCELPPAPCSWSRSEHVASHFSSPRKLEEQL